MRRVILLSAIILSAAVLLTGCAGSGKLDEGDCECTLTFADVPKEFSLMDESMQAGFYISVSMQNINTEKYYSLKLSQENDFTETARLHSGSFRILHASAQLPGNISLEVQPSKNDFTLSPDVSTLITLSLKDTEGFTKNWMETHPLPEMLLADKFSRVIQIDRRVMSFADLPKTLDYKNEKSGEAISGEEELVPAYGKKTFEDVDRGISVTLMNPSDSSASYRDCQVVEVYVQQNHCVLPGGLTLGQPTEKICAGDGSLYGTPDRFTGFPLISWGTDHVSAIYSDAASGDCITLTLDGNGRRVMACRYELAVYRYEEAKK